MLRQILVLAAVFVLQIHQSFAQENSTDGLPSIEPTVSTKILALTLDPMTTEELKKETSAWLAILKEKAQAMADLEIQLIEGNIDKQEAHAQITQLRKEKFELIIRTKLVLKAYELKGGDIDLAEKYIKVIKGTKSEEKGVGSKVDSFKAWLTSRDGGIEAAIQILKFIGVMVLFWLISAFSSRVIRRALERREEFSELLRDFINKISRRAILAVGLVIALGTVGVNVGAALALIGGGAFIVGLALQDTLSNFANGVMLLIYRPFDVGSAVEVGGIKGKVDSVSMVSTTILTFDNQKVLVPNKMVWGQVITNITGMDNRRVDLIFGIGYEDDIAKAQEIIQRVVDEHELILTDPEPNIGVHELADSSVNIRCWAWAPTSDYLTVRTELTRNVKEGFDAAGISIPFPQRDVHLYTVPTDKAQIESV